MNRSAHLSLALLLLASVICLSACSPAFNWREVRPDNTALTALLPCKPDKASKTVPLGGQATELSMLGCEAGGATFAIAVADMGSPAKTAEVLAGWQAVTLANMKAPDVGTGGTSAAPLKLAGASSAPPAVVVSAQGSQADGRAVVSRAAYFAQGSQVFQAVIYAPRIDAEVAETFFSGLKLQ